MLNAQIVLDFGAVWIADFGLGVLNLCLMIISEEEVCAVAKSEDFELTGQG